MKYALITTTINIPKLLDDYLENAVNNNIDEIIVIVIGDKKTPTPAEAFCDDLKQKYPFVIEYYSPEKQLTYLENFPELRDHLPWNSIQRRNIGLLRAYEYGAEIIITIDDDNYVIQKNYFDCFKMIGESESIQAVQANNGWFNVCSFLKEESGTKFYHRGYPASLRGIESTAEYTWINMTGRSMVIGGLWMEDPDVDAVQRLACPVRVINYEREDNFALAPNTWSPFNSQNTGIHRDVIPSYFLSPNVGRYDDIWASYIVRRIADHLGDIISFGNPLVRQDRNPHNYFKDLDKERPGMEMTERVCDFLRQTKLEGTNYQECFAEIIAAADSWTQNALWTDTEKIYLAQWFDGCKIWKKTFEKLKS